MFNSKLIKPLVLVSTLQETQEIQEQVKQHYEKKTNPEGRALKKKKALVYSFQKVHTMAVMVHQKAMM